MLPTDRKLTEIAKRFCAAESRWNDVFAACDQAAAAGQKRRLKTLESKSNRLCSEVCRLRRRAASIKTVSIAGLQAKARMLQVDTDDNGDFRTLMESLLSDIILAAAETNAVAAPSHQPRLDELRSAAEIEVSRLIEFLDRVDGYSTTELELDGDECEVAAEDVLEWEGAIHD